MGLHLLIRNQIKLIIQLSPQPPTGLMKTSTSSTRNSKIQLKGRTPPFKLTITSTYQLYNKMKNPYHNFTIVTTQ